ncbi:MAG TPA: nucleotidyltransferase family protein [Aliidongia sp.]|nr:nucleotidyltransferase family protein [Aliidongia sp.]
MIRPRTAIVLAAGRGERLRPITDTLPKPLVRIGGRTLLDHALDRLEAAGVERVVVNVHYLGERITEHLAGRRSPEIVISAETESLETGGGIRNALPLLGAEPFFAVNGDSLWRDGATSALHRLADAFDPARHDIMLLLQRTATAVGYDEGLGDFTLDQQGTPVWRREGEVAPYLYAGVQLLTPRLFEDTPEGRFSMIVLFRRALAAGRLGAIVHDGEWFHVSTPAGMTLVEERYRGRRGDR